MSIYNRTTRECLPSQWPPESYQAIQNYFQEQQLGNPETEFVACCETISSKGNTNWLLSWLNGELDATVHTGILLTSERLIWVRNADSSGVVLTAANLKEIRIGTYAPQFTRDTGLEIIGYVQGSKGRIRGYIGMGPEPAAQKFRDEVKEAIDKINPPSKRRLPKWLGG
ncbi:MAG: hypothetical protein JXA21_12875 [Anaerolineae bacterium]|nr:hypothetical protein [Anaerolineae bacterium]